MTLTLTDALRSRPNDHSKIRAAFEERTGHPWHAPTPAALAAGRAVSVVIPARNTAHSIGPVLDALAAQDTSGPIEVIVVDDASTDTTTAAVAADHPAVDILVRLGRPTGSAAARNAGTRLASADTIVYLDADMVLPPHALADIAARADQDTVLVGFRHNIPFQPGEHGCARVPDGPADLAADHRVTWHSLGGRQLYSGITLDGPTIGSPLDDTLDFQTLGHGAFYLDWDLPRMVVTALLGVPRRAVIDVGGFDQVFGKLGWGTEDTHLGAVLIATGCLIIPLRQAIGFHLDPPDAAAQWQSKLATWPRTLEHYRSLLNEQAPSGRSEVFRSTTDRLLTQAEVSYR